MVAHSQDQPGAITSTMLTHINIRNFAIVEQLDLDIPNKLTVVTGETGAGKSIMIDALGLALGNRADSGSVRIGEVELTGLKDKALTALRRDEIGFVFQSFNLVPTLTAKENVLLPLAIAGRRPDAEWFDQVVATVGLADRLGHRPNQLSGGQQQRVLIARALAGEPEIILMDEPFAALDPLTKSALLDDIVSLKRDLGFSSVLVTRDFSEALRLADIKAVMDKGQIVQSGNSYF